jgi:hypothetical protein
MNACLLLTGMLMIRINLQCGPDAHFLDLMEWDAEWLVACACRLSCFRAAALYCCNEMARQLLCRCLAANQPPAPHELNCCQNRARGHCSVLALQIS